MNSENSISKQINLVRKYLKLKILEDNVTFRNHSQERNYVYDLIRRTILQGESHSGLVIGPNGCGKTTLINSVLHQLSKEIDLTSDAIIVKLNGLVHHNDKITLKSITMQMQLENTVGDRVFGTFAENLAFLLSCLRAGSDRRCKSMVFILEEFDMFCHSGRSQTVLYNLFDITHSNQAPVCVIGITHRSDVMELLEKRVKSRFSHRHVFMFPSEVTSPSEPRSTRLQDCVETMEILLKVPRFNTGATSKKKRARKSVAPQEQMELDQDYSIPEEVLTRCLVDLNQFSDLQPEFCEEWNSHITRLIEDQRVIEAVEKFCYYSYNEQVFRNVLFQIVSNLGPKTSHIDASDICTAIDNAVDGERRVKQLQSLSVLELSLVIAMTHAADIFEDDAINFEMVLHRYTKFANANSSTQTVPRPVILKAFEHLQTLEIIKPITNDSSYDTNANKVQKEYKLYTLAVPTLDVQEAVKTYKALPTEIKHWFSNSVI